MSNAIAIIHKQTIIERIASGEPGNKVAKSMNITPAALYNQLKDDPDYQAALDISLEVRLENRENEMEGASDGLSISRARELLKLAMWRCEKEGKRWKDDAKVLNVQPIFNIITSNAPPSYTYDNDVLRTTDVMLNGTDEHGGG